MYCSRRSSFACPGGGLGGVGGGRSVAAVQFAVLRGWLRETSADGCMHVTLVARRTEQRLSGTARHGSAHGSARELA
jgi:hypothetical protein